MSSIFFYYDPVTQLDRLFEGARSSIMSPSFVDMGQVDIHESKDTNTLTATFELPGLTPDNVTVEIHQDRLTVSSARPDSQRGPEEGAYAVRERRFGKFSRTLRLPVGIKPEDVKARMENGVLTITFPKTLPDQLPTRIDIQ